MCRYWIFTENDKYTIAGNIKNYKSIVVHYISDGFVFLTITMGNTTVIDGKMYVEDFISMMSSSSL